MVDENYLCLSGIVKFKPIIVIEKDGHYRAKMTIECWRHDISKDEKESIVKIPHKDQHTVHMYGQLAAHCKEFIAEGSHVLIKGFLKTHRWIDFETGDQEFRSEIVATSFDLLNYPRLKNTHNATNDSSAS